jgi:hypothetical protein
VGFKIPDCKKERDENRDAGHGTRDEMS